jgi:hypothetical protein
MGGDYIDKVRPQDSCFDNMLNHYLSPKLKLIGNDEFSHLTNILTNNNNTNIKIYIYTYTQKMRIKV